MDVGGDAIATTWSSPAMHGRPAANRLMGHWPALDGIRAVAVTAVVIYHLGAGWLPGGFLGVDIFFVLSGFLITSLLVDEFQRNGRLDIRRFYLRRARRLFPALWLMLVTVVLVTAAVVPSELGRLRGDVIAALAYVTNWTQILWSQSYFQALGPPSLLEHLWSLAVEEQFYLIWPIVLVACLASKRKSLPLVVTLVGIVLSTLLMSALYSPFHDPSRVYYGSDTHAAPVLIGAALALARFNILTARQNAGRRRRAARPTVGLDLAALGGAAVLVYFMTQVKYTEPNLYHGGFVVVGLATAVVVGAAVRAETITARLLGASGLRWVGVRSYGIYLWHWPIIQLTRPGLHPVVHGFALDVMRIALTVLAAAISYKFLELPIRTRGFVAFVRGSARRGGAFAREAGAAIAIGAVVVVTAASLAGAKVSSAAAGPPGDHGPQTTISISLAPPTPTTSAKPSPSKPVGSSSTAKPSPTPKPQPPFPRPVRVGFFGDSQGMTLLINKPAGLTPYLTITDDTIEGCGILGGIASSRNGQSRDLTADCGGWAQHWAANAARDKPQIAVVEIGAWEVLNLKVNGRALVFGSTEWDAYFDKQLASGITALLHAGAQVGLLTVPCYQPITAGGLLAIPERGDRARTAHMNTRLQVAANANPQRVFMVQSPKQFCSDPNVVGNTAYRWDGTHFYKPGAALEFQVITPELLAIPQPPTS